MQTGEYPDDWSDRRKQVLERDGYECQECGSSDRTLHVHHVTPISEGGSHRLSNLETLCESVTPRSIRFRLSFVQPFRRTSVSE